MRQWNAMAAVAGLIGSGAVWGASPYDAIYAFGDSLSDAGNVFAATGEPVSPYFNGQFSNGNVWLQTLATDLGLAPLTPSLAGGRDFAYGGAESGQTLYHTATPIDVTGSTGQIAQFQLSLGLHGADPNALYTLWIGSNDLLNLNATNTNRTALSQQAVGNIDSALGSLAHLGAKNILVVTVPDLGKTPKAIAFGTAGEAAASGEAQFFNNLLENGNAGLGVQSLAAVASTDKLNITVLDTYSLLDQLVAGGTFANVTQPCFTGTFTSGLTGGATVCGTTQAQQDHYLFWDDIHPTAGAHALLGADAYAAVSSVPLPASAWLALSGFVGLALVTRRRNRPRI